MTKGHKGNRSYAVAARAQLRRNWVYSFIVGCVVLNFPIPIPIPSLVLAICDAIDWRTAVGGTK